MLIILIFFLLRSGQCLSFLRSFVQYIVFLYEICFLLFLFGLLRSLAFILSLLLTAIFILHLSQSLLYFYTCFFQSLLFIFSLPLPLQFLILNLKFVITLFIYDLGYSILSPYNKVTIFFIIWINHLFDLLNFFLWKHLLGLRQYLILLLWFRFLQRCFHFFLRFSFFQPFNWF